MSGRLMVYHNTQKHSTVEIPQNKKGITGELSFRLAWLKIISCLAVIYAHSYTPQYEFFSAAVKPFPFIIKIEQFFVLYIALIAVPVFFSASGYIYFLKNYEISWIKFAWRKFRSIMLPYFIWNTLALIGVFIIQIPEFARKIFPPGKIVADFDAAQWFSAYAGWGEEWFPFLYPLWFLPYLFVVFIIIHALRKVFYRWDWPIWALLLLHLICSSYTPLLKRLDDCVFIILINYALSIFAVGKLLIKYGQAIDSSKMLWASGTAFIIALLLDIYKLVPDIQWMTLLIYLGVIFMFSLSGRIVKYKDKLWKQVMLLADFSFFVYLAHAFLLSGLQAIIYPLLPRQPLAVLAAFLLLPLLIYAILVPVGFILKKILPQVYEFLVGGR